MSKCLSGQAHINTSAASVDCRLTNTGRAIEVALLWALHSPLSGKLCVRITWVDTGGEKKGEEPQNNYLNELRFLLYLNIDTFSSSPQGIIFTMNIKSSLTHKIIAPALQLHKTCLGVINGSEQC